MPALAQMPKYTHRNGVLYPGFHMPNSPERHRIYAGTPSLFMISSGDLLAITDEEGGAALLALPFNAGGHLAPGAIGLEESRLSPLEPGKQDERNILAWLQSRGVDQTCLTAARLFGTGSQPGDQIVLKAHEPAEVWLVIAAGPQTIIEGAGGGSAVVEIKRALGNSPRLPDPARRVRDEFQVDRGTAKAYELAKGEYVQVIDIEGRQCSDFMAMRSSALDRGLERHIDSTVTRTMTRSNVPNPGLFDRFYDQDMQPLLALVRDTVGRHDSFALACTARGYEEHGFPGHVNCSDNISTVFGHYGIGARQAWPAINFFFNTEIQSSNGQLISDESWSRPGDHVVMEALQDLVCVSTACPDDIDPINGWNPTDVHVRIYGPAQKIARAVAYRPFPESEAILTRESAFHARTSKLTRNFAVARDYWLPADFEATRTIEEYWTCRSAVSIQDMSSLRKFDIVGPGSERLLQLALTRNIAKLSVNRGTYALMCDETGALIDDGTLFRLAPDLFRWCGGSDESGRQFNRIAAGRGIDARVRAIGSSLPNLAIQGPRSRELLSRLVFTNRTQPSLEQLRWFGCTVARLKDWNGPAFMLTRTGYTGELGYEIFCAEQDALAIWDALFEAGEEFGLKAMGGNALEIIRIEAGLMAAGAEFGPDVDAFESGLGFAVDLEKPEFIGRDALVRNAAAQRRRLVGLHLDGDEVPSAGDGVYSGERKIGTVTSATRSPSLERPIAMARVAVEHSARNGSLEIGCLDGHMKRLAAEVVRIPFIDPERKRARA